MFYFGDTEANAILHMDLVRAESGPNFQEKPFDEMTEEELKVAMTYVYSAIKTAMYAGSDQAVVDKLVEWYDAIFMILVEACEWYVEKLASGVILPPHGAEHRRKYLELAGLLRNPSDS